MNAPNREPTLGDEYLEFETSHFPSEGGWTGKEPDPERPAGREVIQYLLNAVDSSFPLAEAWNEEGYGWAFNYRLGKITVNVLVQFSELWLVIVHPVTFRPRFLRGAAYDEAVLEVCRRIHRGILAVPQLTRATWTTRHAYENPKR